MPGKKPVLPVARIRWEKGRTYEGQVRKRKVKAGLGFCLQPQPTSKAAVPITLVRPRSGTRTWKYLRKQI